MSASLGEDRRSRADARQTHHGRGEEFFRLFDDVDRRFAMQRDLEQLERRDDVLGFRPEFIASKGAREGERVPFERQDAIRQVPNAAS